jgi:hypothetical protein
MPLEPILPVDVVTSCTIDRLPDVVSAYAVNPDNVPNWYQNIVATEWKTTPPIRIGSKISFVAKFLGRRLEYTYEVVVFVPGVRFVMRTAEGPFPMETTYTWQAVGSASTRMTLRNRGEPNGFSSILAPMMSFAMRQANQKDLKRLKVVLERS